MSDLGVIRPGDKVLVRLSGGNSPADFDRIVASLKAQLPGCEVVVLTGVEGFDIYRPDPPAEGT